MRQNILSFQMLSHGLHQVKGLTKATSSTSTPPAKRPTTHESPQPAVRPAKLRRPASPTPSYEMPPASREREDVIGMDRGGVPGIKTEHQEALPSEGGREVAVPEYSEEVAEQFGIQPPDLHYQEEMAQALAEGTVGKTFFHSISIEIIPTKLSMVRLLDRTVAKTF